MVDNAFGSSWMVGWWTGMTHEMGVRWDPNPEHH